MIAKIHMRREHSPLLAAMLWLCVLLLVVAMARLWWPVPTGHALAAQPQQPLRIELNTASEPELQRLPGVSRGLSRRIVNYRNLKGYFVRKEDLKQVYGLDTLYHRLAPYVYVDEGRLSRLLAADTITPVHRPPLNLNTCTAAQLTHPRLLTAAQARKLLALRDKQGPFRHWAQVQHATGWPQPLLRRLQQNAYCGAVLPPLDLNRADSAALVRLPGIGPYTARKIVRYREVLGFYHSTAQLAEVYGMRAQNLQQILPLVQVTDTTPYPHLAINSLDCWALARHPYFRNKNQCKQLLAWRDAQGGIRDQQHLLQAPLDATWLKKIAPYMVYDKQ